MGELDSALVTLAFDFARFGLKEYVLLVGD